MLTEPVGQCKNRVVRIRTFVRSDQVAKRYVSGAGTIVLALALGGCMVGPDYKKPATWTTAEWQHAKLKGLPVF